MHTSTTKKEETHESTSLTKKLWAAKDFCRWSQYFVCVAQDRLIILQWMAPYSGIHGQRELELVVFFFLRT